VNKALLYYYFRDKETLYGAAIERIFAGLKDRLVPVLDSALPPREKLLAYAAAHFDYVAQSAVIPRMVGREVMRAGRAGSPHLKRIAEKFLRPVHGRLRKLLTEGIASGDFRELDVDQFIVSMVGLIVFYFMASAMVRLLSGAEPLAPERIAARKQAVLQVIAAAAAPVPAQRSPVRGKS
jgi:TetR/AcrR family transcriptional regulator